MRRTITLAGVVVASTLGLLPLLARATPPFPVGGGEIWFESPASLPVSAVRSAAAADWTGDGRIDVAVTTNAAVHFFAGLGGRRFESIPDLRGFVRPDIQAVADVREDGVEDLILLEDDDGYALVVIERDGSGGFVATTTVPLGVDSPQPTIAVGDVNGDGHVDALVAKSLSDSVEILAGWGDGTFDPASPLLLVEDPSTLLLGDFDADGDLDLFLRSDAEWLPFVNDGAGSLAAAPPVPHPLGWLVQAVLDVDGDGFADVLAVDHSSSPPPDSLVLLLGDGAGSFAAASSTECGVELSQSATGDADGDGRLDVILGSRDGFQVLFGNALGAFDAGPVRSDAAAGVRSPVAADLDGDGALDYLRALSEDVHLYFNDGNDGNDGSDGSATFPSSSPTRLPGGDRTRDLVVTDIDADGHADLVTLEFGDFSGNGSVTVRRGEGDRAFAAGIASTAGARPEAFALADFDEDGLLDAAVGKEIGSSVFILLGDGAGAFEVHSDIDLGDGCGTVIAADFDSDGHADVVAADDDDSSFLLFLARGDGRGAFSAPTPAIAASTFRALAGDCDGNGRIDLVTIPAGGNRVVVWAGDGNGGFFLRSDTHYSFNGGRPAVADVNGDGRSDVILGARVFPSGEGAPIDSTAELLDGRTTSIRATPADVDGDGRLDLVHSTSNGGVIEILRGDGSGRFAALHPPVAGPGVGTATLVADVDGDCLMDVAGFDSAQVAIVYGKAPSFLDPRAGNVGAALGPPANVLFVNGRRGDGPCRTVDVDRHELFQVRMKPAPADPDGSSGFALYAWVGVPTSATIAPLPFGYGTMCMAPELAGGNPKRTWNNTGDSTFGLPDRPSTKAPSVVLRREAGVGKRVTFFLQGLIEDPGSPSGAFAVTNGVLVRSL